MPKTNYSANVINLENMTAGMPTASETVKGGAKIGKGLKMEGDVLNLSAAPATAEDTQEVHITADGKLVTKPRLGTDVEELTFTYEDGNTRKVRIVVDNG